MSIRIGETEFDQAHYDARGDVLYLRVSPAREPARTLETPEGHAIDFDARGEMVGMVLLNVRWTLDREGAITLSRPADRLEADRLASALSTAA